MTTTSTTTMTSIQRLVAACGRGLEALAVAGHEPDAEGLEALAVLIYVSMSGRGRSFHTVEHVFDLCRDATPLQTLAALFHDAVYVQVDGGLSPEHQALLGDAAIGEGRTWRLTEAGAAEDPLREMVLRLFELEPGQEISPFSGLNEYLSALLAVRALEPHLARAQLAQVAACVEATIPFRPAGDGTLTRLAERLAEVDRSFGLGLGEEGVRQTIHQACGLANRDVANFAQADTARFLDATWMLLPETNVPLRLRRRYTLGDYRRAIETMERFLTGLDPDRIYRSYQGKPTPGEITVLRRAAALNLAAASRYMQAKLVASALLESMALRTGGDVPIAMFMGDLPDRQPRTPRFEDLLPPHPPDDQMASDLRPEIVRLLDEGRHQDVTFDIPSSPTSAYLYRALGDAALVEVVALARSAAARSGPGLLEALPADVLATLCRACATMAPTRAARLEALCQEVAACRPG